MSRLRIAPIVEGHGEDNAVRILLQRIWTELLGGDWVEVIRPIRGKRMKLVQSRELARAIDLAMLKLRSIESSDPTMILVLLDADETAPCQLGPDLIELARTHRGDADISCVVANVEYETWFGARKALEPKLSSHLSPRSACPTWGSANRPGLRRSRFGLVCASNLPARSSPPAALGSCASRRSKSAAVSAA